jgi:hypothetical protein
MTWGEPYSRKGEPLMFSHHLTVSVMSNTSLSCGIDFARSGPIGGET